MLLTAYITCIISPVYDPVHILMNIKDPVTKWDPSGAYAIALMHPACAFGTCTSSFPPGLQLLMVLLRELVTKWDPSGA